MVDLVRQVRRDVLEVYGIAVTAAVPDLANEVLEGSKVGLTSTRRLERRALFETLQNLVPTALRNVIDERQRRFPFGVSF